MKNILARKKIVALMHRRADELKDSACTLHSMEREVVDSDTVLMEECEKVRGLLYGIADENFGVADKIDEFVKKALVKRKK